MAMHRPLSEQIALVQLGQRGGASGDLELGDSGAAERAVSDMRTSVTSSCTPDSTECGSSPSSRWICRSAIRFML